MLLLRRSDSISRPNVRPVAGVPDHTVGLSKKQTNEGVNNVRTVTLKRGHYAVDTLEVGETGANCNKCKL